MLERIVIRKGESSNVMRAVGFVIKIIKVFGMHQEYTLMSGREQKSEIW